MRLYSLVDLTGNVNMIKKLVLGGTGTRGRGEDRGAWGGLAPPQNKKLAPQKNYQPNPPNPSPNFLFFNKV